MRSTDPCWPGFLDLVSGDPERAAVELYHYTLRLLQVSPPRVVRSIASDERRDLVHEIVLHCIQDNFRTLKGYQNKGSPFAAWFYFVVRSVTIDFLRARGRDPDSIAVRDQDQDWPEITRVDSHTPRIDPIELKEALTAVRHCMQRLTEHCRMLVMMAAEEYEPREMALLLGWPADKAKKISDDLRYSRKKLVDCVEGQGIDLESLL